MLIASYLPKSTNLPPVGASFLLMKLRVTLSTVTDNCFVLGTKWFLSSGIHGFPVPLLVLVLVVVMVLLAMCRDDRDVMGVYHDPLPQRRMVLARSSMGFSPSQLHCHRQHSHTTTLSPLRHNNITPSYHTLSKDHIRHHTITPPRSVPAKEATSTPYL